MTKQSHCYDVDLLGLWQPENWLQSIMQSYCIYFVILYHHLYILLHTVLSFTVTCTVTALYFVLLPMSHCCFV